MKPSIQLDIGLPSVRRQVRRSGKSEPGLLLSVFMALTCASLFSGIEASSGIKIRPFDGMMFLLLVYALCAHFNLVIRVLEEMFGIVLAWLAICAIRAGSPWIAYGDTKQALVEFAQGMEFVAFIVVLGIATRTPLLRKSFIRWFFVFTLIVAIYGLISQLTGEGPLKSLKLLDEPKYSYGVVVLILVSGWLSGIARWRWPVLSLSLGGSVALLLISGERNAWLGILAVIALFLVKAGTLVRLKAMRRMLIPTVSVLAIVVVVILILARGNEVVGRQIDRLMEPLELIDWQTLDFDFAGAESPSNQSRLFQMSNLRHIVMEKPLFGVGTEMYVRYAYPIAMSAGLKSVNGIHGQYWLLLGENGIIAFSLYILIWIAFFRGCKHLERRVPTDWIPSLLLIQSFGIYGGVTNLFIGGGAVNLLLTFLPVGLLAGLRLQWGAFRRASRHPVRMPLASAVKSI